MEQPLRIPKKDLVRPPVLLVLPAVPEKKVDAKPAPLEKNALLPETVSALPWGNFSAAVHGILALQDIRKFKTYGLGGYMKYMLPRFFSEKLRLFASIQVSQLWSEKFESLLIPVFTGFHGELFRFNREFLVYVEAALGFGYEKFTHTGTEKDAWRGSVQLALGAGYFIVQNFSLNLEFATLYITREQALPEMLRLQAAGVLHF